MSIPSHLTLELVTPERSVAVETVDEVEIPGADGYLGVLPGHTPLLVTLQVGELWYRQGGRKTYLSVAFGFAEILPDRVRVLADTAERAEEIEMLRFLEYGFRVKMVEISDENSIPVDYPDDITQVENLLREAEDLVPDEEKSDENF